MFRVLGWYSFDQYIMISTWKASVLFGAGWRVELYKIGESTGNSRFVFRLYILYYYLLYLHRGPRLNLNLCLFLQTFNAISESEYVKIGSMCIFSWFQQFFYQKIQLYTFLGSNLSHVSYQLGKGCCLPIFTQYFAHNLYNDQKSLPSNISATSVVN